MAPTPEMRKTKTKRKFVRPQLTDYGKLDAITMATFQGTAVFTGQGWKKRTGSNFFDFGP